MKWFRRPSSAPLWQDEFSVFTADERYVNRRQFTKFLTLTSFAMFAGNLWILARSLFHRAPVVSGSRPSRRSDEMPVGGVKTVRVSDGRRSLHPGAHGRRFLRGLQPEMHASFVRRLLRAGAEPAGVPMPSGLLLDCRRRGAARAAAAPAAARRCCETKDGQLVAVGMEGEAA